MINYTIVPHSLETLGIPMLFNIFDPDKRKERMGYALVFANTESKEAMLWDIQVDSNYRRQGVATALLDGIKEVHDAITTANRTPEGEFMCLANNFEWEKSEGGNSYLVWRKVNNKEVIDEGQGQNG